MNFLQVKVHISYPSSIVRVEDFPLEIEVGSYLPAAVTMRNSDGNVQGLLNINSFPQILLLISVCVDIVHVDCL